jgi:DNA-binding CsgD family transcriptional regulator
LAPSSVTAQIEAIQGGGVDPSFARRVIDLADGNPFHVEELVALGGPWSSLPVSLRDVSLTRVERLGPDVEATLRRAAVIGREFDEHLLAALTEGSDPRDGIRSAVDASVLAPTDDGRHYRFRHALLWEAVYEDILPAERIAIHRRVAEALVTDPGLTSARGAGDAAEIARHYDLGQQFDLARTAYIRAGDLALRARAWAEAATAFERVLQIDTLHVAPSDANDLSLADRAMQALWYSGRPRQGEELLRTALERAGAGHDPLELAASWMHLSNLLNDVGDDPASRAAAARARAIAPRRPPNEVRLLAMGALASSYMVDDRNRRAVRLAGCVIAMADELGAQRVMAEARAQRGPALLALGRVIEAERDFDIARRLAADADDPYGLSIVLYNFGANLGFVGAFEEGLKRVLEASAIAVDLGLERSWEPWLRPSAAEFCFWLGRWDEADRHLATARTYEIHGLPLGMAAYVEAALAAHRGDGGQADAALAEAAAAIASGIALQGLSRAVRARVQLIAGDAPAALATVDDGIALLASTDDLAARAQLASLGAEAAADLAERRAARRDPVAARDLADRAEGYARFAAEIAGGRLVPGSVATPLTSAHAAHAHAEALRAAGKAEVDAWAEAITAFEGMRARPMVALTRFRLAEAALVAGDRTAGRDALLGARSIAHEIGDRWLGSAIAGLARRGRLDLNEDHAKAEADAVPSAPSRDPWALSARESEVLALVADGLTNREIARRLFITEKTASSHVTHILDKLGVTSRTEAALVAVKAGGVATSWSDAPVGSPSAAQRPPDRTGG